MHLPVEPSRRPMILHIAAEYPHPFRPHTTNAVKALVEAAHEFDHVVFSLRRVARPAQAGLRDLGQAANIRLFALDYCDPSGAIGLPWTMRRIAKRIVRCLAHERLVPDAIHAHKLAYEGIAAMAVHARLKIPYMVSVRGEAEVKIVRYLRPYRGLVRKVVASASRIFYVSAWFRDELRRTAPVDAATERLLPNIVFNGTRTPEATHPRNRFLIAICDRYRKKGVPELLEALATATGPAASTGLDIYSSGNAESEAAVRGLIVRHGLADRVEIISRLSSDAFLDRLGSYLAMTMPSRNETFGNVYVEALFAGIPILYTRDSGVDGFLNGLDVGISVPEGDVEAIRSALQTLVSDHAEFRQRIAQSRPVLAERFGAQRTRDGYVAEIRAVLDPTITGRFLRQPAQA